MINGQIGLEHYWKLMMFILTSWSSYVKFWTEHLRVGLWLTNSFLDSYKWLSEFDSHLVTPTFVFLSNPLICRSDRAISSWCLSGSLILQSNELDSQLMLHTWVFVFNIALFIFIERLVRPGLMKYLNITMEQYFLV